MREPAWITRRIGRIDLFEIQILRVGHHVRATPRDAVVAAEHDDGQTDETHAGDAQLRRIDIEHVPERRNLQAEVRIVREQRAAIGGMTAGHGPGIAADIAAAATQHVFELVLQRRDRGELFALRRSVVEIGGCDRRRSVGRIVREERRELLRIEALARDEAAHFLAEVAAEIEREDLDPRE